MLRSDTFPEIVVISRYSLMSEVCFLEVAIPSRGRYTYTVNPQIFAVLLFREIRGHDKNAKFYGRELISVLPL